jgi:hypothetical protein
VATRNLLFVLGAAAVAVSASIHLHLWLGGYSGIATIGPLFLLQAIGGYTLAAAILVLRRPSVALAAAGYLLATMAGFLLSVNVGLFGFQDSWSAPWATTAFADEAAGAVLLLSAAAAAARSSAGTRGSTTSRTATSRPSRRVGAGETHS